MKKKIIMGLVAGLAVVGIAVAAIATSVNTRFTESDLITKNIEALSNGEGQGGTIECSGGSRKCATAYLNDGSERTLYMP